MASRGPKAGSKTRLTRRRCRREVRAAFGRTVGEVVAAGGRRDQVEQNVTHGFNLLVALIVLSIGPAIMIVYHIGFERRRWSESMFGGGDDSDDDDD